MKRELERVEIPGEHDARVRTWSVVRAAFLERERVTWPRRHAHALVLASAAVAIVAATFTPPGRSVVNSIRDAVGREKVSGVRNAHQELVHLPSSGALLVQSRRGPWVVQPSGSRRLLGSYRMAAWSPHGRYLTAVLNRYELVVLDPNGNVRWEKPRKQRLRFPHWSSDGFRIAYLSDRTLRVITGDGVRDWGLGIADPSVAPAWRPGTHEVSYVGADGSVRVVNADTRRLLRRAPAAGTVRALMWSDDGLRLLVLEGTSVRVFTASGRLVGAASTQGVSTAAAFAPRSHRIALVAGAHVVLVDADSLAVASRPLFSATTNLGELAWSPDGKWLLVAWRGADQFVFVRVKPPQLLAVSNVARQFDPAAPQPSFPVLAGWCCTR